MTTPKRKVQPPPHEGRIPTGEIRSVVRAIHVAPVESDWIVLKAGPKRIRRTFGSPKDAFRFALEVRKSRPAEIIVHDRDAGIIRHADRDLSVLPQAFR